MFKQRSNMILNYNKFIKESFEKDDEDLLEIKEIFQELADDWDIYFVEEIDWSEVNDENNFIYSIQSVNSPNHPYKLLVNFILPEDRDKLIWKNLDKFISDIENIEQRLINMGYENVTHHHFDDEEYAKGRHFQFRI